MAVTRPNRLLEASWWDFWRSVSCRAPRLDGMKRAIKPSTLHPFSFSYYGILLTRDGVGIKEQDCVAVNGENEVSYGSRIHSLSAFVWPDEVCGAKPPLIFLNRLSSAIDEGFAVKRISQCIILQSCFARYLYWLC